VSGTAASLDIRVDDLRGAAIAALLEEHLAAMRAASPACSVHALDLDALRGPRITFWTAWDGDDLLGCGALKALDAHTAELKSMRTATPYLRRGVARAMLAHIVADATRRGMRRLYLETGSTAPFEPACRLYERAGFARCGPFADYVDDAFSVFMTKAL
jgi:putative acetyltransferase